MASERDCTPVCFHWDQISEDIIVSEAKRVKQCGCMIDCGGRMALNGGSFQNEFKNENLLVILFSIMSVNIYVNKRAPYWNRASVLFLHCPLKDLKRDIRKKPRNSTTKKQVQSLFWNSPDRTFDWSVRRVWAGVKKMKLWTSRFYNRHEQNCQWLIIHQMIKKGFVLSRKRGSSFREIPQFPEKQVWILKEEKEKYFMSIIW